MKRSNIEAICRADAKAEKALKRARLLEDRRAAKKASATLEEMDTMLVAAEAVLTETRETTEALTVSALQLAHEMSHRAETMGASSSETARFPGEHESLRRGVRGSHFGSSHFHSKT